MKSANDSFRILLKDPSSNIGMDSINQLIQHVSIFTPRNAECDLFFFGNCQSFGYFRACTQTRRVTGEAINCLIFYDL